MKSVDFGKCDHCNCWFLGEHDCMNTGHFSSKTLNDSHEAKTHNAVSDDGTTYITVLTPSTVDDNSTKIYKEAVEHPDHYGGKDSPYETIKVIEAWELNFNIGNAVKYLSRYKEKGKPTEDLEKALWYIRRELDQLCGQKTHK